MISMENFLAATIFSILLAFIMVNLLVKKNFLLDQINTSKHKKLTINNSSNKVVLCGGIIIFISSIFFFDEELHLLKIFSFFILGIGILSDINKLNSPKLRIIFQFFTVLLFLLYYKNLAIGDLRIIFLNNILAIKLVSLFFTIFCILILINGTNFLDGLNTLVVGYYILVLTIIVITSLQFNLYVNPNIVYLIIFLCVVFLLNFFNKVYLGDAGSYLTPFLTAFFVLDFFSKNNIVSPYFICLLLWYPAFENSFSILRRNFYKKKVDQADQDHLHQIIYRLLKNKNYLNKNYINTASAMLINTFNFFIFIFSYKYYNSTKITVLLIFLNIFIYLLLYFFLKKKLNNSKKFFYKI